MKFLNVLKMLPVLGVVFFASCEEQEEKISVTVAISDYKSINSEEIVATITPDKNTARYTYAIGLESDRASFSDGSMVGVLGGTDKMEVKFEQLKENTTYTIFARGFDKNDNAGSIASVAVRTDLGVFTANMKYATSTASAVEIKGNANTFKLLYALSNEEGKSSDFLAGSMEGIKEYPETIRYVVNEFELTPNTKYVAYTASYDRAGVVSEVIELPFTTPAEGTTPEVSFVSGDIDNYIGSYNFTPNDKCSKYAVLLSETTQYESLISHKEHGAGDIMGYFDFWISNENATIQTDKATTALTFRTPNLIPETPLTFYVLTYDLDGNPFGIQKITEKTPAVDAALLEPKVTLDILDVREDGATLKFVADENTLGFLFEIFAVDAYEDVFMKNHNTTDIYSELVIKDIYEQLISAGRNIINANNEGNEGGRWIYNKKEFIYKYYENAFLPGTKYYAVCCPIGPNGIDAGFGGYVVKVFNTAGTAPEIPVE